MLPPSCPSCQAQLQPAAPGAAAVRCPRCGSAFPPAPPEDGTRTFSPPATGDYQPGAAETLTHRPRADRSAAPDAGFFAPPEQPDELGRLGPYRVLARIGAGGMGVVFRAEEPQLKRMVALKVMLPQFASNDTWKARFLREAHAQAAVEHEHVVAIYRADEQDGVAYIAMPLLKGQTLGAALRQNPRPPLREVLRIGREMAEGLAAAHEQGLIHRDVKPGNVWLDGPKRRVKLLDFGLARTADAGDPTGGATAAGGVPSQTEAEADAPLTVQGAVVGTPAYMSPEQARGKPMNARSDLFSLGVVLYQMAVGHLPFTGPTTAALLTALETADPPAPAAVASDVPLPLSDFILRLLSKSPADRPESAEEVAESLERLTGVLTKTAVNLLPQTVPADDPWGDLNDDSATTATAPGIRAAQTVATPWYYRTRKLAATLVVIITVAAVLIWLNGPPARGTLAIESEDPDAELMIARGEEIVRRRTRDREIQLEPGIYTAELVGGRTRNQLIPGTFAISNNQTTRIKVIVAPNAAETLLLPDLPAPIGPDVLSARLPSVRYDFSAGRPRNGPEPFVGPGGDPEIGYTSSAWYCRAARGNWQQKFEQMPGNAAVEVRARVTSAVGAWTFDVPSGKLSVDHLGVLTIETATTAVDTRPREVMMPSVIKKRGEWNAVLAVVRDGTIDVFVNGEKVVSRMRVGGGSVRPLVVGIERRKENVEIEIERVTTWDLAADLRK